MEYLPHGDLSGYLDEFGPLPEHEVQQIAHQILEGLQCMHNHKFVHRDLKPQNVLIKERGPDWWVKLGDFGISKRMEDVASLHTFTGTRGFMAPEVLAQHGLLHCEALSRYDSYTNAVDIWAFGALVFRALTGRQPFENLASYVDRKTSFPSQLLYKRNVSQGGCNLIEKLLVAIPENRLTASEALDDPWFAAQREPSGRASVESQR
jgi:calcium/calmodulin-dependent protein kinase I